MIFDAVFRADSDYANRFFIWVRGGHLYLKSFETKDKARDFICSLKTKIKDFEIHLSFENQRQIINLSLFSKNK